MPQLCVKFLSTFVKFSIFANCSCASVFSFCFCCCSYFCLLSYNFRNVYQCSPLWRKSVRNCCRNNDVARQTRACIRATHTHTRPYTLSTHICSLTVHWLSIHHSVPQFVVTNSHSSQLCSKFYFQVFS